jgi:hypothetical protein
VVELAQIALQDALANIGSVAGSPHPLNGMVLFVTAIVLAFRSGRHAHRR